MTTLLWDNTGFTWYLAKVPRVLGGSVVLVAAYLISKAFYNVYFHPLSKFPGPKLHAASHIPLSLAMIQGQHIFKIKALHEIYGDVVRIAPNELHFSSGAAIRDLTTKPGVPKSPRFYFTNPGQASSILTVMSNADHSRYRRLLSHAFSEKALREQEPLINKYIDLLFTKLHETAGTPQDMVSWFNFVSFDIIGDLTMGESFGCLQNSELHPWVSLLFKFFKSSAQISVMRRFTVLWQVYPYLVPKSLMEARRNHIAFTRGKVVQRMEQGAVRPDFMSNILKHNEKETGMSESEIVSTFGLLLLAGSETTATLLSVVTYYLLTNQRVLTKLSKEIRTSFSNEEDINMVSVNQLKYELAVLDEAMRIHPPVPIGTVRQTPPEGATIDGHWVTGNTSVWAGQYVLHQSATNWTDPELFVPERWLDDPKYAFDDKTAFVPFSLGPRNCIGRNLAYAEMRVILTRLLWNFDLKLDDRSKNWVDMKAFLLWEKSPLYVTLAPVVRKT